MIIGKRWVWKGGCSHLVQSPKLCREVGEIFVDDEISVSNFRFLSQISGGSSLLTIIKVAPPNGSCA